MGVAQRIQVGIDCRDPFQLAEFWTAVLDYRRLDAPGGETWEEHSRTNAEEPGEAWCKIGDPDGVGPTLLFHRTPDPTPGKNRIHLDVRAPQGPGDAMDRVNTFAERVAELGGRKVRAVTDDAGHFVVMADPEENVFCIGAGES